MSLPGRTRNMQRVEGEFAGTLLSWGWLSAGGGAAGTGALPAAARGRQRLRSARLSCQMVQIS